MSDRKKVTLPVLFDKMAKGVPLTMITCYDYPMAVLVEKAGIDIVLVGDSLGMTVLGYDTTLPVTMEDMIPHAKAVTRGCKNAFVVGDMPYMSYQVSISEAIRNAGRFMGEAGCDGIKLEGGLSMAETVAAIVRAGIPVMGHLGLTPQSMSALGGFKVQGKEAVMAKRIIDDAKALEDAGAFAILLECVPAKVSGLITQQASIPIIGIGGGIECDGQLLIFHDLFNLYPQFTPKFAKQYADVAAIILDGLNRYVQEVRSGAFPEPKHSFTISDVELAKLKESLEGQPSAVSNPP
jgi:3-methyl-2-oxobutanoate hydroxymethyltransferase